MKAHPGGNQYDSRRSLASELGPGMELQSIINEAEDGYTSGTSCNRPVARSGKQKITKGTGDQDPQTACIWRWLLMPPVRSRLGHQSKLAAPSCQAVAHGCAQNSGNDSCDNEVRGARHDHACCRTGWGTEISVCFGDGTARLRIMSVATASMMAPTGVRGRNPIRRSSLV